MRSLLQSVVQKGRSYLILFLHTSSIHGLNQLIVVKRHPLEILLWLTMLVFSLCGSVYLSGSTWIRYQQSPTVVSIDSGMYSWNITFPAATVCLEQKIDEDKLQTFLQNANEKERNGMEEFIRSLSNASFENFDTIPKYDAIPPEKYLTTLLELIPTFKPGLTIGTDRVKLPMVLTVTEMGFCYAVNSVLGTYISTDYILANKWDTDTPKNSPFVVHPLDGEVLGQIMFIPTGFNVYIHSPYEVSDVLSSYIHNPVGFYTRLLITASSVYTTPEAARLSVGQRRCRFVNETNLKHSPVYSYTMCRIECRINLCLKYCQCIPFFYRRIGEERICNVTGLHCLTTHKAVGNLSDPNDNTLNSILVELKTLRDKQGKKINCECLPTCDEDNYVIQFNPSQPWSLGSHFQWGMVTYPRIRYKRDIIFGFTDVLVSVGGMAGLFLGCSVLSFLEIVYFITLRLFCYTYMKQ